MILEDGNEITMRFLPTDIFEANYLYAEDGTAGAETNDIRQHISFPPEGLPHDQVESVLKEIALKKTGGNITRAGEVPGVTRDRVRYFLKKHRLANN